MPLCLKDQHSLSAAVEIRASFLVPYTSEKRRAPVLPGAGVKGQGKAENKLESPRDQASLHIFSRRNEGPQPTGRRREHSVPEGITAIGCGRCPGGGAIFIHDINPKEGQPRERAELSEGVDIEKGGDPAWPSVEAQCDGERGVAGHSGTLRDGEVDNLSLHREQVEPGVMNQI